VGFYLSLMLSMVAKVTGSSSVVIRRGHCYSATLSARSLLDYSCRRNLHIAWLMMAGFDPCGLDFRRVFWGSWEVNAASRASSTRRSLSLYHYLEKLSGLSLYCRQMVATGMA